MLWPLLTLPVCSRFTPFLRFSIRFHYFRRFLPDDIFSLPDNSDVDFRCFQDFHSDFQLHERQFRR